MGLESRLRAALALNRLLCFAWFMSLLMLPADEIRAESKADEALPTLEAKTAGLNAQQGFLNFYNDTRRGKIWLEIPPPQGERGEALQLIYVGGLTSGLGSNPVGLDRGQIGDSKLLSVRRLGPKVLFEELNHRYRAISDDPAELRATAESFATSVLWAGEIAALDPDGRSLVDFTSFLIRDAHGVVGTLKETEQGDFKLDAARSAVDPAACLAFPDNIELEALLTFTSSEPGEHVQSTAPTPEAVSLVTHYSLVRLPEPGYQPRRFDPRIGMLAIDFLDYGAELDEPVRKQWIQRHRLVKVDPAAERSRVVEPLIYYLDPGVPEPVRSALLDGARWWSDAFDEAGFIDAYRVEMLPEGVHPLDVRYNVIQWVHRSTRGWSYGTGVVDPRTGEILKGHVNLGSLRVRQDRLLFEGLAGTAKTGSGDADDPIQLALARIRQLSAHEVGHTLGITHNFAASTYDDRASVMDYPAPLVTVDGEGALDFSRAYGVGIGSWDVHTIRYGYSEPAPGVDEAEHLAAIVRDGLEAGLVFLSDDDARPAGAAEARANLWDNGTDPVDQLNVNLAVRRIALERFGEHNVLPGTPLAELQEVLATVYFHHRFQLDAAVKVVAGMEYNYAVRGDGQTVTQMIPGERQRRALKALLGILTPSTLDLPESVLELLAPRPFESERNREMFASSVEPAFDALGAAATAADQVMVALMQPERLGRLIDFHRRDASQPSLAEVLETIERAIFARPLDAAARHAELQHIVRRVVVDRWLELAVRPDVPRQVRAHLERALLRVRKSLPERDATEASAYDLALAGDIDRFMERRGRHMEPWLPPAPLPPGSPIGQAVPHHVGCSH
ncbi:MAG: zinc-dependent metalloprotease [Acidobacteriota bacterium]